MVAIPQPLDTTPIRIYKKWSDAKNAEPARAYLGASSIGDPCSRKLWYDLRWAGKQLFEGRMLRLFDRGHREEPRIIQDMRDVGIEVHSHDASGKQFEFSSFGGHMLGHPDAFIKGIVEAPKTWHIAEFKTHNQKRFDELVKLGVAKAQTKHYYQCQWYMGKASMQRCAYFAINKNTDEIYLERIDFDAIYFAAIEEKAQAIIFSAAPPPRLSDKPDWYECKFCHHHGICHGVGRPDVNCRTCAYAAAEKDGTWSCHFHKGTIPPDFMRKGCDQHRYIPVLLEKFATPVAADDSGENWVRYELHPQYGGGTFTNGDAPGLSSREIKAPILPDVLGHPAIEQMKAQFPGAVLQGDPNAAAE
jgi:hypothetical protein